MVEATRNSGMGGYGMLSSTQRKTLPLDPGYAINYKINKALLLKELRDLVPAADDTLHKIFCEKLEWNHKKLEDSSNLYLLKKIRPKYLCRSADAVLELRKEDQVANIRKFLRDEIRKFFADDIRARSDPVNIDEFSRSLYDQIKEVDAELKVLKRKYKNELIMDASAAAVGGIGTIFALTIDFGPAVASLIPALVGLLPAIPAGQSIYDATKKYRASLAELKAKPTFVLGSYREKMP